jgi:hypothetical protein
MLARVVFARGVTKFSVRNASIASKKTPPTLEEFDPLNPGEWQLGAGGKILPRLPEGTRCGKLVMGKYGLYDPNLRKKVEAFQAGLDAGKKSENARPFDATLITILKVLAHFCLLMAVWNMAVLIIGRPIWPMASLKPVGSS